MNSFGDNIVEAMASPFDKNYIWIILKNDEVIFANITDKTIIKKKMQG